MTLDAVTLAAATVFTELLFAVLTLLAWSGNQGDCSLLRLGLGLLLSCAGTLLLLSHGILPVQAGIQIGTMLVLAGFGQMWQSARMFEGKTSCPLAAMAGAILWLLMCQVPSFAGSTAVVIATGSLVPAAYVLLATLDLWSGRRDMSPSCHMVIAVGLIHALFLIARAGLVTEIPLPSGIESFSHPGAMLSLVMPLETLAFLVLWTSGRLSMSHERIAERERRAASIDLLTGVASRRALVSGAANMQLRAVIMFDLDRFKQINDLYGHEAGDRVLARFARIAADTLGPDILFGRLGGEEFAACLEEADMGSALSLAEHVRVAVARSALPDEVGVTVSAGVSISDTALPFSEMLRAADRALYGAKRAGRNRSEEITAATYTWDRCEPAMARLAAA